MGITVSIVVLEWTTRKMNELIICRECVNSDCTGCNMLVLYHALERNRFEALMNENRHLNIDTDVAPIRHGQWIMTAEFTDCIYAQCDQCKITQVFYYNKPLTNYCPNCGARMDKDGNA